MIDDVGVESEQVNYGTRRLLFNEIIDEAEHNKNVLILTTNLNIEELEAKYGARTIDRLRAITTPVIFKGESLRGRIESQYVLP
jgi:DNA replication protein DnaC